MKALTKYSKFLKKKLAYEAILKDLHEQALRELRKCPDGKTEVSNVEFHLTIKSEKKFSDSAEEKMKDLRDQISGIKSAEEAGRVVINEKETFDASIPRSSKEEVLAEVPDYKKHFMI